MTLVDGYVVEGHVPVRTLLRDGCRGEAARRAGGLCVLQASAYRGIPYKGTALQEKGKADAVPTADTAERAKTVTASAKRILRGILLSCSRSCERRWIAVIGAARLPLL
jgi:hypothetical protein